ncbi:MAG TPA: hypothetical protein VMY34_11505 [Acidimicrobiales bacterium]|nr:hypothetical protein [Acidimicrobiales bacterium]
MPHYALLILPSANRVYGQAAPVLAAAELAVVLDGFVERPEVALIAKVPYLTFEAELLGDDAMHRIASLSSAYALFERDGEALLPIELPRVARFDDDLVTIPRYTGKTNEAFTALLVNVTRAAAGWPTDHMRLLDPVCGRGTTLSQGLLAGFRVAGIEIEGRAVDAYEQFLTTWLQDKRLKHTVHGGRIRRDGKVVGRRVDVVIGSSKAELAGGGATSVTVVHDDARFATKHFSKRSFDLIVGDLPYGVQHGSGRGGERSRSPLALVQTALEGWIEVLRPGGAIGLAFNTKILPRPDLVAALAAGGIEVRDSGPWLEFEHRVDRAIQRDLVVAVSSP